MCKIFFALFMAVPFLCYSQDRSYSARFSVQDCPIVKDSTVLLKDIEEFSKISSNTQLTNCGSDNLKILTYKKIKINGSKDHFVLLEYEYKDGLPEYFPWRHQLILDSNGKLVEHLTANSVQLLKVSFNEDPYLLALIVHRRGMGGHQLLKMQKGKLEKVFDSYDLHFKPETYNAYKSSYYNDPFEMNMSIKDDNKDGFNDLIFTGKIIYNGRGNSVEDDLKNNKNIDVKMIFQFDKKTGRFISKEDYAKKYSFL